MSTRMPPRGRGPQKPVTQPVAYKGEHKTTAAKPERKRRLDFLIVLVVVGLVAVYAAVSSGAAPVDNPGVTLPGGKNKTPKPGTTAAAGNNTPATDLPRITEVMSSNSGAITAEDGKYYDWVEIYNPTNKTINLQGFALSDNLKKPTKCILPSYPLEPGKYAIVFLDGLDDESKLKLHASFKLKATEPQSLILVEPSGTQVQSIPIPELKSNASYSLDMNDGKTWSVTDSSTPGFPNTKEGEAAFAQTRRATSDVIINEVMAGNTLTIKDGDGEYSDWVELYNGSDKEIDLTGWGLSNRESEPKRWEFPEMKLGPKKYLTVFVSGKNQSEAGKELHTDFRLNAFKDTILLSNFRGQIVSQIAINNLKSDTSFGMVPGTTNWEIFTHPTPGQPNNEDGFIALQSAMFADEPGDIVISEVMGNNVDTLKDQYEDYPDWIELFNRSNKDIKLDGWGLTDKSDELGRWRLPDVTIKAGEYLTIFASGRNLTDAKNNLHTDFAIGSGGDILVLTQPGGEIADRCFVPALRSGVAYARPNGKAQFEYSSSPTPGKENTQGYASIAPEPMLSHKAGMYDNDFTLTITATDSNTKVYYTLNGDTPTKNSTLYSGPIDIKKKTKTTNGKAITGATVVRAIALRDGSLPSNPVCATYFVGTDIHLPVLSIAVDNDPMFNPATGLYMKGPKAESKYPYHGSNFFKDTELPAHLELIEPEGIIGISQDVGLRIFGQYSRGENFKGLALIARSEYGANALEYQIFPDQPFTSYKSVVLKPGGQDVHRTGMRDVLAASLARDAIQNDESGGPSVYVQAYRTAVQFVNGEFWGVTHIREKINTHTIAQHYNVDENKVWILEGTGKIVKAGGTAAKEDFLDMIDFAQDNDLSNQANFDKIATMMDIDSYIDWLRCKSAPATPIWQTSACGRHRRRAASGGGSSMISAGASTL